MYSASPHLSKHDKPDDYLAMSSVDIAGLCFPGFSNPGKSFTAAVCVLSQCNMKVGCEFKVSLRSTDWLIPPHIYFPLSCEHMTCFSSQLKLQLLGANYWTVLRTLKKVD